MGATLLLAVTAPLTPLVEKTVELVSRRLAERGGPAIERVDAHQAEVVFDIALPVGAEAFRIGRDDAGAWRVTGGDERGLLYGAGKFLRGCRIAADGGWSYAGPTGDFAPALPVRGMYFATHFHNFYHDAPLEQVVRYVEELALWGCNMLSVWFDMHHYRGIDDPAAQEMIARLHAILKAANAVGMGAAFTTLANEAYSTSPPELRAEPFPHHYHVELCPSKPEGLALILQWREEMLRAFADINIEALWIWPYDQGGCACEACKPWGGNGFVRNAEAVGALVRRMLPNTRTVVSTWELGYWEGDPEWDAFYAAMSPKPDWVDYLMAEGHGDYPPYILRHGPPPGIPLLNFPEISMSGMWPWGGFGANLQPARLQHVWDSIKTHLAGGYPYSEGIFEDLNKAVCLQLYWDPERPVRDIVREYAAELAPDAAEEITAAVYLLEANMGHGPADHPQLEAWLADPDGQHVLYQMPNLKEPATPLALLNAAERTMTPAAKATWRWRLLWLRAALDEELSRSGGCPTERSEELFREVESISSAEEAEWHVCAPHKAMIAQYLQAETAAVKVN
ncbi:MAG: hypothetical protein ACYDBB_11000 [Armatimonadota bacterium]